jgi:hypothetical protein
MTARRLGFRLVLALGSAAGSLAVADVPEARAAVTASGVIGG